MAAASVALPSAVLAADPNDVARDLDNPTTALTSITQGTAGTGAFAANGNGDGEGVIGTTDTIHTAGVLGIAGSPVGSAYDADTDLDTGVYGFAGIDGTSSGVFGEGPTGVYGYGDYAVYADGGTVGVFASGYPQGTGVHAHAGTGAPPAPVTNVALLGTVTSTNQAGIYAKGRVIFRIRSGRTTITAGHSSKALSVADVTSSNICFAMLNSSRSGIYVRAVVPSTGKITIYLNKAVTATTYIAWLVLG